MLEDKEARLLLIGGDSYSLPERKKLEAFAESLGIGDRVSFLGSVEQTKLPLYYAAADVGVVASFYETFGLVALEALACGTPVVTTDVGDMRNIITAENGCLVADNEPRKLAPAIDGILAGENADCAAIRQSVGRYSWPNIAAAVAAEYEATLKEPQPVA